MKKTWKLFKILLKNSGLLHFSKNRLLNVVILVALLFGVIGFSTGTVSLTTLIYKQLEIINQTGLILSYLLVSMGAIIFFFGIFYMLAVFYYSKDLENLLYMPFKAQQIIMAKFLTVVVYEYIMVVVFYVPITITYGIMEKNTFLYYIYVLVVGIFIPFIPLIIAGIFVMIVLRYTNIGKKKEMMTFISGILVLGISLGFNFFIQSLTTKDLDMNQIVAKLDEGNNSLMSIVQNMFPGMQYGAKALVYSQEIEGIINLFIFVLFIGVSLIIFNVIAQKLYFKGAIGMTDTTAKRAKINQNEWNKVSRKSGVIISFMKREVRLLMRSPVYFLNSILISFLLPLIFLVFIFLTPNSDPEIQKMILFISGGSSPGVKILVLFALGLSLGGMNGIAATGISREGNGVVYMKFLPVKIQKQVMAKVFVGAIVGYIGVIICSLIMFYLKVSPELIIIGLILALFGTMITGLLGIFIDLLHPKLNWDNEQQALKQNINLLLVIFISVGLAFASVIGVYYLNVSLPFIVTICLIISSLLCYIMYLLIDKVAIPSFMKQDI